MKRVRIRPSKPASILGLFVGIVFVGIGLFVILPLFSSVGGIFFGAFAVFWTLVAAAIAVTHGMNVFSKHGVATTEIDIEGGNLFEGASGELPFDERLRRLEQLRQEGLVTEQEYQRKREELMRSQW